MGISGKTELKNKAELFIPQRVKVLNIPLHIVPPENLPDLIYGLLASHSSAEKNSLPEVKGKNIVLLSIWDLLKTKWNSDYRLFVMRADLVIPISKSLISGAHFISGKTPYRYMPFNFVISLLGILEQREYTAYLLGGKYSILKKTENNLRRTFPHLRIVGRFPAAFKKHEENVIIEAIQKAAPHLLLVNKGIRGGELWIAKNNNNLGKGIRLWCSDLFDVFAEKKKRPSESVFEHGLESIGYCIKRPYKFFRIFPYILYKILLLIYKIFNL